MNKNIDKRWRYKYFINRVYLFYFNINGVCIKVY